MNTFSELSTTLQEAIKKKGITEPTQIQEETIPYILNGEDVIGESATGSGKTLAFSVGIAEHTVPGEGIQALVLTPTRELADQVNKAVAHFAPELNTTCIYGGVSMDNQLREIPHAEVVVATPGRLLDHMRRRNIDLSGVHTLILDEADRMLDMGFIEDVEQIISQCPKERQTLFFSATITPEVDMLAEKYMHDPIEVSAEKMVDPAKLEQIYFDTPPRMKIALLVHRLQQEESSLVMVFCNTRNTTDFVTEGLKKNDVDAIPIHGGLNQNKRSKIIQSFNDAKVKVLVCTDVAARGLHIDNVSHVYNYDLPNDPRDYVHRIGRTARAGDSGMVINLLAPMDHDNFGRIIRDYRDFRIEHVEMPRVKKVTIARPPSRDRAGNGNFRGKPRGGPRGRQGNDRPRQGGRPLRNRARN